VIWLTENQCEDGPLLLQSMLFKNAYTTNLSTDTLCVSDESVMSGVASSRASSARDRLQQQLRTTSACASQEFGTFLHNASRVAPRECYAADRSTPELGLCRRFRVGECWNHRRYDGSCRSAIDNAKLGLVFSLARNRRHPKRPPKPRPSSAHRKRMQWTKKTGSLQQNG